MPLNVPIPVQRSSNVKGPVREGATSTKEIVNIFPGRQKMFVHAAEYSGVCREDSSWHGRLDRSASKFEMETLVDGRHHPGELEKVSGTVSHSGLLRKKNMKTYWSRKSVSQSTPFFATVIPYRMFALFQRVLHVGPIDAPARGQPAFDPWDKVRPVLDSVNSTFKQHYTSPQFISIDESMVGMKNRVVYLQYMPNKRHSRFGIKKFELCEALTGYVLHVELYAGKDFPIQSDMGQAHAVVMKLLREANVLNKGYHLFTDNLYTKPVLANECCEHFVDRHSTPQLEGLTCAARPARQWRHAAGSVAREEISEEASSRAQHQRGFWHEGSANWSWPAQVEAEIRCCVLQVHGWGGPQRP